MSVDWESEPQGFDAIRLAGRVTRYHTIPGCDQTVAAHSWGVATIILHYFPLEASGELLKAALYHDAPEIETGDIPANFKWSNPEIDVLLEAAETAWYERTGTNTVLTEREKHILKLADSFELLWYCYEQACQGNLYTLRPFTRVHGRMLGRMNFDMEHPLWGPVEDLYNRSRRNFYIRPDQRY